MGNTPQIKKVITYSISVYFLWVITTYLLEGRILTLLRPEAAVDRIVYTVIANFLMGIIIACWVLRSSLVSGFVSVEQIGFRSLRYTLAAVVTAGVIGFILFIVQNPPSSNPVVIMNVYAQVLTVSVAEVVVCWAVIGASFESLARNEGKIISLLAGILAASFSFGIYHFAHSPPFNHTLALFGVMQALEKSGNLVAYSQPIYPLIAMAFISVIILAASDILFIRRKIEAIK
jgi:hypothetical protein